MSTVKAVFENWAEGGRNQQMMSDYMGGSTTYAIAQKHNMSNQNVSNILRRMVAVELGHTKFDLRSARALMAAHYEKKN